MEDETTVLVQTVGSDGKPPEVVRVKAKEGMSTTAVAAIAIAGILFVLTFFMALAALILAMGLSHKIDTLITLHAINAEALTCGVDETLVHATRTITGVSYGGSCALINNATDVNVNTTVCEPNEALLGATYQTNGDTIVGTCFALNSNGTLPDINNATLTCSGQQIAVTQTIRGTGLAQDPFCQLPVTANTTVNSTSFVGTIGNFTFQPVGIPGTYGGPGIFLNITTNFAGQVISVTTTNTSASILPVANGGTGSGAPVTNGKLLVGSGGTIVSSTIDESAVPVVTTTNNTVNTTSGWTGGNAHSITAFLTKTGNVVLCRILDNTPISVTDVADFITVVFLIPVGYRPVVGITLQGSVFIGPNNVVSAPFIIDSSGNLFVYKNTWNGQFIFNDIFTQSTNMRLSAGTDATHLTWSTV